VGSSACSGPGDAYEKNARSALQHLKLNSDKDVKFLYLGTNEAMWIALDARKVHATMISPPATLFGRKAGMNFLVNLADLKIEYQGSTFATRRSLIKTSPNLTLRTTRAMVRGYSSFQNSP
jgi:ABC-type nitrate/sulfonate/bicarbonate transport system substrate-binding protein